MLLYGAINLQANHYPHFSAVPHCFCHFFNHKISLFELSSFNLMIIILRRHLDSKNVKLNRAVPLRNTFQFESNIAGHSLGADFRGVIFSSHHAEGRKYLSNFAFNLSLIIELTLPLNSVNLTVVSTS